MVPHASLSIVLAETGVGALQCLKYHLVLADSFRINDFALINLTRKKQYSKAASEQNARREREGERSAETEENDKKREMRQGGLNFIYR